MTKEEKIVEQFFAYLGKSHRITEVLERAEIKVLDDYLKKNPAIENILKTPAKELMDTKYKYLISSIEPEDEHVTLYDLISLSIKSIGGTIKSFFNIETETKNLKGFVAIICSGTEIIGIKMFSFDIDHPYITLACDLANLIPELKQKYTCIKWDSLEENPANKAYKKIAQKMVVVLRHIKPPIQAKIAYNILFPE